MTYNKVVEIIYTKNVGLHSLSYIRLYFSNVNGPRAICAIFSDHINANYISGILEIKNKNI